MNDLILRIKDLLDWILSALIVPLFKGCSILLQYLLIAPLDMLGLPLSFKICASAIFTVFISLWIRRLLKVDEREMEFQKAFMERKKAQEYISKLDDWKKQKILYDASDDDLDERFNEYMAQRFARYGLTYMLPVFLMLFWLDHLPEVISLREQTGGLFIIMFPHDFFGIPGISMPLLFLSVYCISIFLYFRLRKKPVQRL